MAVVHITDRAAREIAEIREYSTSRWGAGQAAKYIEGIDRALGLLTEQPGILLSKPEISGHLKFYIAGEHVLALDAVGDDIYLMTIMHSKMALGSRIRDLEPTLAQEVAVMRAKAKQAKEPKP